MSTDVLDRKEAFKTKRTSFYKKRKIRIFPKGLVNRFCGKFEISLALILCKIDNKKGCVDVL